jgi:membrane-associated protease RseP (regulator of RpoE activity)
MTGTEATRSRVGSSPLRGWSRMLLLAGPLVLAAEPMGGQVVRDAPAPAVGVLHARGWLGISVTVMGRAGEPTDQIIVDDVWDGSPALASGIRSGDRIVRVNGAPVTGDRFRSLTRRLEPGDPMTLGLLRDGREVEITLVAAERPDRTVLVPQQLQAELDAVRGRLTQILEGSQARVTSGEGTETATLHLVAPNIVVDRVDGDSITTRVVLAGDSLVSTVRVRTTGADSVISYKFEVARPRPGDAVPFSVWVRGPDSTAVVRAETLKRIEADAARRREAQERARVVGTRSPEAVPDAAGAATLIRPLAPFLAGMNLVAGAEVRSLTAELAPFFGVEDGVLVTNVAEDTPAGGAGLRSGDVIVAVNEVPVDSVEELRQVLSRLRSEVRLGVIRKGQSIAIRLR